LGLRSRVFEAFCPDYESLQLVNESAAGVSPVDLSGGAADGSRNFYFSHKKAEKWLFLQTRGLTV
jgi:hypothetical protein